MTEHMRRLRDKARLHREEFLGAAIALRPYDSAAADFALQLSQGLAAALASLSKLDTPGGEP